MKKEKIKISIYIVLFIALASSFSAKQVWSASQPDLNSIQMVQESDNLEPIQKTKQISVYGSFAVVEAPVNGAKWFLDQVVGGIGKVGSYLIDGLLYPAKWVTRKNQNNAAR